MDLVEKIKKNVDPKEYEDVEKVVLAFSGGLDTSVMVKLVQEVCDAKVVTLTINLGQEFSLKGVEEKAKQLGAYRHYTLDARKEFIDDFVFPSVKVNCLYQRAYPLCTALGRPLIAKKMVEIADEEKADAVAHGSTGKGNDQVRFDLGIRTLNPSLKIIAPIRDWNLWRDEEIEYAKQNDIPISHSVNRPYSTDENMWGRSIECGVLEDPDQEPPKDVFEWITLPEDCRKKEAYVKVFFEKGVPVRIKTDDFESKNPVRFVTFLNGFAGSHGVGMVDHMEDRIVGLKSREIYEVPAAMSVLTAHRDLEKSVFTREENIFKQLVDQKWSEIVYGGLWFSPLKRELDAYVEESQKTVSGSVTLKFFKGSLRVVGRNSKYLLYDKKLATYDKTTSFDQKDALGFIKLYGYNSVLAENREKKE